MSPFFSGAGTGKPTKNLIFTLFTCKGEYFRPNGGS